MISGVEFNGRNEGVRFVKLTNESCCHNGFKFEWGLNVDTLEFNESEECGPGGLYFCKYEDVGKWISYKGQPEIKYMWDVTIPDYSKVIIMKNKIKASSIILSNKQAIWKNQDLYLEITKQNKHALQFLKEQTEDICLAIVKQCGCALKHVENQTVKICFEAVKQDGCALQFVHYQTEKMCLEAVKQNGKALEYVRVQTEEICLEAVKQDGYMLRYVKEQTKDICLEAVKQDGFSLSYVKEQTEEICLEAVKQDGFFEPC